VFPVLYSRPAPPGRPPPDGERLGPVVLFPNWSPRRRCEHVVGPDSRVPIGSQGMVWETAPKPSQFPRRIPEEQNKFLPTLPSNEDNEKKAKHNCLHVGVGSGFLVVVAKNDRHVGKKKSLQQPGFPRGPRP
jgi:hypothetical protein